MAKILGLSALAAISSLAACTSIPTGPSMMALPGSGRSFEQFRYDDYYCREFASEQIGGTTPNRASISSSVTSAGVGAGLGAAAGAALAGGRGAAIGAGPVWLLAVWPAPVPQARPDMQASNDTIRDTCNACMAKGIVYRYPGRWPTTLICTALTSI